MRAAVDSVPEVLSLPLDVLLACGGDRRVQVDPVTRKSQYGCCVSPLSEVVSLASSTASTISPRGYAAAEAVHQTLRIESGKAGLDRAAEAAALRMEPQVRALLQIDSSIELVFSASGTDSQLHAFVLARMLCGRPLVSVVAAADETGSGVVDAVSGRHFNPLSPHGTNVSKGGPLRGLEGSPSCIQIPCRESSGRVSPLTQLDDEIFEAVSRAISIAGAAVVYAMDHSKLGSRCPSIECLDKIRARWGDSVYVVVDACQARLSRARINWYLEKNFFVVLTGSKFFAGPAFSGVLLVPASLSGLLASLRSIPHDLGLYAWRGHWPRHWDGIWSKLGDTANVGALLRWAAAIEEMRAYFEVPDKVRAKVLREFSEAVPQLISRCPSLEPLSEQRATFRDQIDDEEMSSRTVFSFLVRHGNSYADARICRQIWADLAADLTVSHQHPRSRADMKVGRQLFHIGQPVEIAMASSCRAAALRISVDARTVYEIWEGERCAQHTYTLTGQLQRIAQALKKLELIVATTQ